MSEVLITLVIIGIVAAVTVPTIVAKQREQATVEKVKKFYSTMSQAVKRAVFDTGLNVNEWDLGGETYYTRDSSVKFMNYIKPYLSLAADDCGTTRKCYVTTMIKTLNGTNAMAYYSDNRYYKAILNDGSVFWFRTAGEGCLGSGSSSNGGRNACASVWYDINGTKNPNVLGKDIFTFFIMPDGFEPSFSSCQNGGWGCSSYILKNGNMDYLH